MKANRPECTFLPHAARVFKALDKWTANKKVKETFADPDEAFYSLLKNEFNMNPEHLLFQENLGKGRMKGFENRLDTLLKQVDSGKVSGKLAELFYTPSAHANTDPTLSKLLNDYLHTTQYHKNVEDRNINSHARIKNALRRDAFKKGIITNSLAHSVKRMTQQDAEAKFARNESKMNKLAEQAKNGDANAEKEYHELYRREGEILKDTEMAMYGEMIHLIEGKEGVESIINQKLRDNPKMEFDVKDRRPKGEYFLNKNDIYKLKTSDGKVISGDMAEAVLEYTRLTEDLYFDLRNGVDSYINTVIEGQSGLPKERLNDLRTNLKEKIMPSPEKGFYPHFRRGLNIDFMDGLMGHMEDLVLSSNKYFNSPLSINEAMGNIEGYVSGHTRSREMELSREDYSYNFNNVLSSYAKNVARFNYINKINLDTKKSIKQLEGLYKDGVYEGGYGQSVMEFVQDLHKSATGYDQIKNPMINNMVRTMLGLEFISKIGFNPRSAVRNMSQSLMNLVEWSPTQIKESNEFFSTNTDLLNKLNTEMESIGILFTDSAPELIEGMQRTPGGNSSVRYNRESGKMEHIPVTKLEKTVGIVNTIAGVSGKMTAKVENFNRKTTFKIAYAQMFKSLDKPEYHEYLSKSLQESREASNNEPLDSKQLDAAINKNKLDAAKQYAINMTVGLHFDYNAFSKSKALRSKAGSIVGQFQHYSFKFFEKNAEVLRNAKNDVMVGDVNGNDAWKLYRLAMVYFLAPTIASALTGVDIGGIVEHDPSEKLKKLAVGLTGDPSSKEYKKMYFNKGPVIGTLGFPLYSTMLNFGMMTELINMPEDNMLSLLAGFDDQYQKEISNQYKGDKLYAVTKLLNTGLNRFAFRHVPQLLAGNLGWTVQQELAMYPTSKAKAQKKMMRQLNPELFKSLEELEKRGR